MVWGSGSVSYTHLRKVMIAGASLPLVIYVFWQVLSQGIMSQDQLLLSLIHI
ncbi:hypothetical protein P3J6_121076 [Pseudoalteromonas sp. 3J6]|nr:aromatic amino acid transport family protein [Pseudoalteromonas sp. 3J6]CAD2225248.1 hypothetical protein P3J6_121076 [Pseudoalteromonas sp. 3J6]